MLICIWMYYHRLENSWIESFSARACIWIYTSTYWCRRVCTGIYRSVMMFDLYSAGTCCGWYLDNLWLCWVGVWAVPGCNECQMLPLQAFKQALSWCEPTGIHVHTVAYKYIPVHTGTYCYVLVYISTYWYLLVFTILFRCWLCWEAGVCRTPLKCSSPIPTASQMI